jgi:MarR family transcriptional regulator, organic hydroperoxide resistance regulator
MIKDFMRMTRATRRLGRTMQSVADAPVQEACGLNPKELILLRAVEAGSMFPHELSDLTETAAPLVTRAIDRLVELGYVERRPDTVDRRRVALVVTEAGTGASAEGWKAMREVLAHVLRDVPPGTMARLAADMESLSDAVEAKEAASTGSPRPAARSGEDHGGVSA